MSERLPDLSVDATRVAAAALAEDGLTDLTTAVTVRRQVNGKARIEARSPAVLAGVLYAGTIARAAGCTVTWSVREGKQVEPGALGTLKGGLAAMLRAERPLLNVLQRASGIATATRQFVDLVQGTRCKVLHTRKTAPGLRLFDIAAVVAGGGTIHRLDLAQTVMVKDNHWRALQAEGRTLTEALAAARARGALACQVEVESEAQVVEACGARRRSAADRQPAAGNRRRLGAMPPRQANPRVAIEATRGHHSRTCGPTPRRRRLRLGRRAHPQRGRGRHLALELD
ncbi:MAG: hypothetical protein R2909_02495 [Gemmatimonadales bacterium]